MITFDIDEQKSGKYLVYYKKETDEVDSLVMGMMENNKIEGTVPCMKSQVDMVVSYRYDITGLQPVTEYFSGIVSKNKILKLIEEILEEKKLLEEYMLDMESVVLESRYMYVEPATGKVKCLLLPVKHENLPMDVFFRNLIFSMQYDPAEDVSYVTKILNYFNGAEAFSVAGFKKLIEELKRQEPRPVIPAVQNVSSQSSKAQNPGTMVLNSGMAQKMGNNGQRYVNPNLNHRQDGTSGTSIKVPKTYSGTEKESSIDKEKTEQETDKTPVKEKKGFFGRKDKGEKEKKGLFGKKEKPENNKGEVQAKPKSFHGIAIPGSDVVAESENTVDQKTVIPAQNVSMQMHTTTIQNFGETIDLQSYHDAIAEQENTVFNQEKKVCLIRKATKERFFLTKEITKVGRSRENVDIYITDNTSIGRIHAILYLQNGRVFVEDQNSKNGTFLNAHRVTGREEVTSGAHLSMSNEDFEIVFL